MSAILNHVLFWIKPPVMVVFGVILLLALVCMTILFIHRKRSRVVLDLGCPNPNFECGCKICEKLRETYNKAVRVHEKLNEMYDTLAEYGRKLRYPIPPPAKFPYLKKTVNLHLIEKYGDKLGKYQQRLEKYHDKLDKLIDQLK